MASRRTHPDVNQVTDRAAQQSLIKLWDRVVNLEEGLDAANTIIRDQATTITQLSSDLTNANENIQQALAAGGKDTAEGDSGTPVGGGGPDGEGGGGTDDGQGANGCANAGANGHVPAGSSLTPVTAGMIVCGTGQEFSALRAPTVDLPTRDANAAELLRRMIWHLQQAGFTAGRQKNPSGAISNDKLTFQVPGETLFRAYDVFTSKGAFLQTMGTQMLQVFPANYQVDGGIPD